MYLLCCVSIMHQMNRLISKLLCIDLKSILLLSRVVKINKIIIDDVIMNIDNRLPQNLVYGDIKELHLLREHQYHSSLEKIVYQDWTSITSNDIQQSNSIRSLSASRIYNNVNPMTYDYVELMIIEDNTISIRMKIFNEVLSHYKIIKVVMNNDHFDVTLSLIHNNDIYTIRSDTYDVIENESILRSSCNIS